MKILRNEKGILTLDFIFATLMVFAFSAILFTFGLTLSVVEVVQYMTYASARNYSLANLDEDEQLKRGELKFNELMENPALKPLFSNGWYEVSAIDIRDFNDDYPQPDDPGTNGDTATFLGARVTFQASILAMDFPILGSTGEDESAFTANISSFLSREPNLIECRDDFTTQRFRQILQLESTYSGGSVDENAYSPSMDNGC